MSRKDATSATLLSLALALLGFATVGCGKGPQALCVRTWDLQKHVLGYRLDAQGSLFRLLDPGGEVIHRGDLAACQRKLVSELKQRHGTGKRIRLRSTLGGKQFWGDIYYCGGWRIQTNTLTGHSRLLDPEDKRRAWGTYEQCRTAFAGIRLDRQIRNRSPRAVVLVHGLLRSKDSLKKMHRTLTGSGYEAIAVNYPSTRRSIPDHADQISTLLERLEGVEQVSFVTHSLGGIVVRQLLAVKRPWMERLTLGRVVMLAPPNQGSLAADTFKDWAPFKWVTGASGQGLTPDAVKRIPAPPCEFGIIAGGTGGGRGLNPLLPGDNDGTVLVANTRLEGAREHLLIKAWHSFILRDDRAVEATVRFLGEGRFR